MSPRSHSRNYRGRVLAVVATVAVVSGGALGYRQATDGGGSPPAGTANIWVDASGGTCVDHASPVAYPNDGTECSTWDAANDTCENGDTVGVVHGDYGTEDIRGWNSRTGYCTFETVNDGIVNAEVDTGIYQDCGSPNPQTKWLKFLGNTARPTNDGFRFKRFKADCNDHIWVENVEMDAQPAGGTGADTTHAFSIEQFATNITVKNSNLHNGHNSDAFVVTGTDGLLFEGNDVHDLYNDSPGDVIHDEGFRSNGSINVVLRGNHFWSLKVMDVFLTGSSEEATNWTIENNVFESPTGSQGNADLGVFFRSGAGCTPACVQPDGVVIRYNTFITGLGIDLDGQAPPTANGLDIRGNYFDLGVPCGLANTTYGYNVVPVGKSNCGTGAVTLAGDGSTAGFVDYHPYDGNGGGNNSFEPAGDYHLTANSSLKDVGDTNNFPSADRDGNARFVGSAPDVGAYEYGG